ncbi:MAG TPA: nucleotidyltransferase family protein [Bacteroidales bacterium]|nr:nucleotidyltransferase family protein [Bacteroidales bacterium]
MKHDRTIKYLPLEYQVLIGILSNNDTDYFKDEEFKDLVPEKLVALAEKHRLTPILYNYLNRHPHPFDRNLMDHIKELTREHVLRSLNLQSELLKICIRFNQQHISYMTIKGPQLSHFLYNDASRRVCVDLDLFLQNKDEFASASGILHESGYQRTNFPEGGSWFKQRVFSIGKHESVFVNRASKTVIDLHIRPVGNTLFSARFHRHFFSEKQSYDMNGVQILIPSAIHYFIFLCHHGAVHGYASLHWLADICAFYRKYPLPPDELLKTSEMFRLKRNVALSLLILNKYCGISLSPDLIKMWENLRMMRKLKDRFHRNLTRERNHIFTLKGRFEKTVYRFMLAEGFLGKSDVLISIFIRYFYRILKLTESKKTL